MRITDRNIIIQEDWIPKGRKNRPGGNNPCRFITIHETGNYSAGADAAAHAEYLKSTAAAEGYVSWHYTVDEKSIWQHLPDHETAFHAGDGRKGPGNCTSIGIEICVHAGGDFEKAKENAASLVRLLMAEHNLGKDAIVQHNRWSGKNCPQTIRSREGGWKAFLEQVAEETAWYAPARDWAMQKGLTDGTRPEEVCTRAEVWQMLWRLEQRRG